MTEWRYCPQWRYCPECRAPLVSEPHLDGRPLSCPTGHFRKYDNPLPSAIGVIEHNGRYLLLRRAYEPAKGKWDAVGGFLDGDESPEECVKREALEETGLRVEPARLLGVFPSVYGETGINTLGIGFHCVVSDDDPQVELSEENSEHGWFAPEDLPELAFADVRASFAAALGYTRVG